MHLLKTAGNQLINLDLVTMFTWVTDRGPQGLATVSRELVITFTGPAGDHQELRIPDDNEAYELWRYLHRLAIDPLTERYCTPPGDNPTTAAE